MPAKRSCTDSEEPELVAQRERESLDLSPGVQVAVWLELGRTDTQREFWKGCSPRNNASQSAANLNKTINLFLRRHAKYIHGIIAWIGKLHRTLLSPGSIF